MPGAVGKATNGDPNIQAAGAYNQDVLGGKYLGQGNPYLQQQIDNTNNDIMNRDQAGLGLHGLTGGSDYTKMIAKDLAANETALRYGDYANERGLMGQAAQQAPGLAVGDAQRYSGLTSLYGLQQSPLTTAGQYAGSLGGLLGGYSTQTKNPSTLDSIGQGVGILATLFSDRRLKTDIKRIGVTEGGLPLYRYRYMGEGPYHIGAMADEVAALQPHALGPEVGGFSTVDYKEVA
jgi:hypothetical protein